ncbi:MAG TPA: nitrophenyl compound nitroreductase subunit ArsF family protein [Candidatus Deferrimicrobiaceae bacterium]
MKPKTLVTALLLVFVAAGLAWVGVRASRKSAPPPVPVASGTPAGATAAVGNKVVVYYFHGRIRCVSCNKIEELSTKTVDKAFASDLKEGRLAQVAVDVDKPGNEHFVKDYALTGSAVVLVDGRSGAGGRWKNLGEVWTLLDDEPAFSKYIRDSVSGFLAGGPK